MYIPLELSKIVQNYLRPPPKPSTFEKGSIYEIPFSNSKDFTNWCGYLYIISIEEINNFEEEVCYCILEFDTFTPIYKHQNLSFAELQHELIARKLSIYGNKYKLESRLKDAIRRNLPRHKLIDITYIMNRRQVIKRDTKNGIHLTHEQPFTFETISITPKEKVTSTKKYKYLLNKFSDYTFPRNSVYSTFQSNIYDSVRRVPVPA